MATTPGKPLPDPEGESRGCRFHTEAQIYALIEEAVAAERERCAKIAEDKADRINSRWIALDIARDIRNADA